MRETTIKELKKGEWFTLVPVEQAKESQVWIRGAYVREDGCNKYSCTKFEDVFSHETFMKGTRKCYVDFYF